MAEINFSHVTRWHPGASRPAVDNLDFTVNDGEFLSIVGPSGCGKSTILRMITGLDPVNRGDIFIDGTTTKNLAPSQRDVAMVFQTYALYPHMNVADNIGFSLKMQKMKKTQRNERIEKAARQLELTDYLTRRPKELSGGQRQRVAMARAIVRRPKAFLMDEPLSNLDAKLRVSTRSWIIDLQRQLGITTVYVTHDQTEAMTMSDRIVVLNKGQLMQVGTPRELFTQPNNIFVAGFLGTPAMNFFRVAPHELTDITPHSYIPRPNGVWESAETLTIGIRPESFFLCQDNDPQFFATVRVNHCENTGCDVYVRASLINPRVSSCQSTDESITIRLPADHQPERDSLLSLGVPFANRLYFDTHTGNALR